MAGLISQAVTDTNKIATYKPETAQAALPTSTGYTAQGVSIAPKETVQGQLADITAKDSPLMQQAERRAKEGMMSRGLLNSSIAVGAGQDAVLNSALPIAQQDASTYNNANLKTVDANNAALNFGAAASDQASLAGAQLTTDVNKANAAAANQAFESGSAAANNASLANLDAATKQSLSAADIASREKLGLLDASTRKELGYLDSNTRLQMQALDNMSKASLTQMDNQYRQLLQSSQSAANAYQQTVNAIANISIQPNLARETKDAAIATQLNSLREFLRATGNIATTNNQTITGLNLGQYFEFNMPSSEAGIAAANYVQNNTPPPQDPSTLAPGTSPQYYTNPSGASGIPSPGSAAFNQMDWANQAISQLQSGLKQSDIQLSNGSLNLNPDGRDATIRTLNLYKRAKEGDASAQQQFKSSAFGYPNAFLDSQYGNVGRQFGGVSITQL